MKQSQNVVSLNKKTSKHTLFTQVGRSGIRRYGSQIYEEFLPVLRGKDGIKVYEEMRSNDPIVGASLSAIEQTLKRVSWFVKPADDSQLSLWAAEHLRQCMTDMEHTWAEVISDAISFLPFGWAWMESVYKVRKGNSSSKRFQSKYNDGLVGWRKIVLRKQSSFEDWEWDDVNDSVKALIQYDAGSAKYYTIPIETSLHFRTRYEAGNPEGRSILRTAYRPYFFKKNIEDIEAIGIERDLIGLPILEAPEELDLDSDEAAELRSEMQKLIYALRRDEQDGVLLPAGWKIELLGSKGNTKRQFDTDKIINRYDKRIAVSLLAQFILLGMDRVGSFALSKDHTDLFQVSSQAYLDIIAETINDHEIPRLFSLIPKTAALPAHKLPQLIPGKVTAPKLDELGLFLERATKHGYLHPTVETQREVLRLAGLFEHEGLRRDVLENMEKSMADATKEAEKNNAEEAPTFSDNEKLKQILEDDLASKVKVRVKEKEKDKEKNGD